MSLNRESLDQVSNSKALFVFVLEFSMAEHQHPETAAVPKSGSQVTRPVETPPPEGVFTESPELSSTMSVELTTARAETEALLEAIKEVSTSVEAMEGQEGTAKLIKVMLLGLKAQRSISQGANVEMKQIAVKQLDLLRHVATGFQDQTEHLQQISDDIGTILNMLAQSFVKLSDVIKDGHARAKNDGQDIENRHRQLLEKLDSQNVYFLHIRTGVNKVSDHMKNLCCTVEELRTGWGQWQDRSGSLLATLNRNLADLLENHPQNLASMTEEIQKSLKSLETIMKEGLEKKRPAEGPPQSEPKRVKFQHPVTKEEHTGAEKERDQKMAKWWGEIAGSSAASGSNLAGSPPQPMPPHGMAPPVGTPITPMHVPIDTASLWISTTAPTWLLLWSSTSGNDASSDHASSAWSISVKIWRSFEIRERKTLESGLQDFKVAS